MEPRFGRDWAESGGSGGDDCGQRRDVGGGNCGRGRLRGEEEVAGENASLDTVAEVVMRC
jgi:hypothetical protein